jgi:hypothetical protein
MARRPGMTYSSLECSQSSRARPGVTRHVYQQARPPERLGARLRFATLVTPGLGGHDRLIKRTCVLLGLSHFTPPFPAGQTSRVPSGPT